MILYRIGQVMHKNANNVIFESQGVGYSFIMPQTERIEVKEKLKLFLFDIANDYYKATYAFKDFKERLLFIDLINIPGIGPRVAFNILNKGWEYVASLIISGDIDKFDQIPYLSTKHAKLVIVELQNKWSKMLDKSKVEEITQDTSKIQEVKETLKMLGFKVNQIDQALNNIEINQDIDSIIENAIKLMSKRYENTSVTAA